MDKFWKWVKDEAGNESELLLEGVIASSSWWGDEVTPKAFKKELKQHTGDITVRINSPGGDVFAGVSIYNALVEHDGKVTVKVEALAASAASFVAMAGEDIIMLPGSMMMIHNPWTFAMGNKDELSKVVEMLEKTGDSIASIYVARTGKSEEEISELLAAETWMTAQEAVDLGFATEAQEPKKPTVSDSIKNALSFASTVRNAVMQPAMSIKEKTDALKVEEINVSNTTKEPVKAAAEEPKTTDEPKAETPTEVEKTETTEVTDEVVEEDKSVKDKETIMTEQEKVAVAQVIEPKNQAEPTNAAPKANFENYIKSTQAVEDFANVLAAHPGDANEESVARVRAAWKDIAIKNGLAPDSADYFVLPAPLVTKIEDAVKASGIYNALNHTGLDVARVDWDDTDAEADTSRAGGHKKGVDKEEQILDFDNRVIRAQYIYKYLTLNKEDVRQQRSTGALITFVMNELPTRVVREIERAVVIGDGRSPSSNRKIREDASQGGFTPILTDALSPSNTFAVIYTPAPGETKSVSLVKATDEIEVEGDVYLIAKKGYLTDIRLEFIANGTSPIPPSRATTSEALGLEGVFEPKWFNDTTSPDVDAVLVVLSSYKTVGDASIESFTNFVLKENKHEYLSEIYKGGALAGAGVSAVAIATEATS